MKYIFLMLQTASMVQQGSRNQFEVEKMSLAKCQLYNHYEKFPSALSAAELSITHLTEDC